MMRTCNALNVHTMIAGRRSAINISMPELSSISRDKEKLLFRITRNEIFSVTIRYRSHVCFYDDGSVGEKAQSCAEARVAHICRSTGRQESEHLLGTIVGQYRRLISTCAVRAQARVGLITQAAREAARRRQVAMRLEEQMREERGAQWMASLQGPGWARRGRCHSH